MKLYDCRHRHSQTCTVISASCDIVKMTLRCELKTRTEEMAFPNELNGKDMAHGSYKRDGPR